jgi:hypothetical protein
MVRVIGVADRSSAGLRRRSADADAVGGRGTELVEALTLAWGVAPHGDGKRIWFELAAPEGAS